jgi:hypothetical protein
LPGQHDAAAAAAAVTRVPCGWAGEGCALSCCAALPVCLCSGGVELIAWHDWQQVSRGMRCQMGIFWHLLQHDGCQQYRSRHRFFRPRDQQELLSEVLQCASWVPHVCLMIKGKNARACCLWLASCMCSIQLLPAQQLAATLVWLGMGMLPPQLSCMCNSALLCVPVLLQHPQACAQCCQHSMPFMRCGSHVWVHAWLLHHTWYAMLSSSACSFCTSRVRASYGCENGMAHAASDAATYLSCSDWCLSLPNLSRRLVRCSRSAPVSACKSSASLRGHVVRAVCRAVPLPVCRQLHGCCCASGVVKQSSS